MSGFVYRRLVLPNCYIYKSVVQDSATTHLGYKGLGFLQNAGLFLPISLKSFSTESKVKKQKQNSFAVSYLINSCGLSPETAKSVSKKVKFTSAEQPDSILQTLRNYGFTNTHISKLVRIRPSILLSNPEKTILPKLKFFSSFGATNDELATVCSSTPAILAQSLENQLIPSYNFLKSILLSDENVVKAFRKKSWIFQQDLQKNVSPKLAVLRELGVRESFILLILTCYAPVVLQRRDKFNENVKKVIGMGFDPQKFGFIHAMQVFAAISQSTWESKVVVLRRWGWSDDDISSAFKRCPNFMNASENKITSAMDFLVNKMGRQSTDLAIYPDVFLMNLERRVIPRCLVIKVLQSKELVKKLTLSQILSPTEKRFLDKYVTKYKEDVPQLLNIYQRKEGHQVLDLNNCVSSSSGSMPTLKI